MKQNKSNSVRVPVNIIRESHHSYWLWELKITWEQEIAFFLRGGAAYYLQSGV